MNLPKLKLAICRFPYGGNGGVANEAASVGSYLMKTGRQMLKDKELSERIDENLIEVVLNDTPAPMVRNRACIEARNAGADVILMIDSDMKPDIQRPKLIEEGGKIRPSQEFFKNSFMFLYENLIKGLPILIGAPYRGGMKEESTFVFKWQQVSRKPWNEFQESLQMIPNEEACLWKGIAPCAGIGTGLIMFATDLLKLTEPVGPDIDALIQARGEGRIDDIEFKMAMHERPWFYYEWTHDKGLLSYEAQKASTEDATFTRDVCFAGFQKYGTDVTYVYWDAWAGHVKPHVIEAPEIVSAHTVGDKLASIANRGIHSTDSMAYRRRNGPHRPEPTGEMAPRVPMPPKRTDQPFAEDQAVEPTVGPDPATVARLQEAQKRQNQETVAALIADAKDAIEKTKGMNEPYATNYRENAARVLRKYAPDELAALVPDVSDDAIAGVDGRPLTRDEMRGPVEQRAVEKTTMETLVANEKPTQVPTQQEELQGPEKAFTQADLQKAVEDAIKDLKQPPSQGDVQPLPPKQKILEPGDKGYEEAKQRTADARDKFTAGFDPSLREAVQVLTGNLCSIPDARPISAAVLGVDTGYWASEISDACAHAGTGARVACIGDATSNGKPAPEWQNVCGVRVGKTVFAVNGQPDDTNDVMRAMIQAGQQKHLDILFLSMSGGYADQLDVLQKWVSNMAEGGVVCGSTYDEEKYPASVRAIDETFRDVDVSMKPFWAAQV